MELRPQHFYKIETDVDGVQFVTARGWEDLSAYLQAAEAGAARGRGVIGQYLRHPEVARDFAAYWVLYRKYHEDYGVEDNIEDITQSILQDMFCMIMLVDISACASEPAEIRARFDTLGQEMGMQVTVTRQEVFDAMHKV